MLIGLALLGCCLGVIARFYQQYADEQQGPFPKLPARSLITGLVATKSGWGYTLALPVAFGLMGVWLGTTQPGLVAIAQLVLLFCLLAASLVDLKSYNLPDELVLGACLAGILFSATVPALHGQPSDLHGHLTSLKIGFLGLLLGSGFLLWFTVALEVLIKKEAFGFGDVKLLGAIGVFGGWEAALFAIIGGCVLGTLTLPLLAKTGHIKKGSEIYTDPTENPEAKDSNHIPFGPFLAAAGILYMLWLKEPVIAYLAYLSENLA